MTGCTEPLAAIRAFDPAGDDLPDAVALHLDGCAECRAAFEARFAKVPVDLGEVPDTLASTLLTPLGPAAERSPTNLEASPEEEPGRRVWSVPGFALAASALLVVAFGGMLAVGGGGSLAYVLQGAAPARPPFPAVSPASRANHATRDTGEAGAGRLPAATRPTAVNGAPASAGHDNFVANPTSAAENQPSSDTFDAHVPNGVTLVAEDPLSTFAIDVDGGAYTFVRRQLREGYLPPTGAVRPEEFINYFPYDYAAPADGDPFGVDLEVAPSPWHAGRDLVRIGIQGKKVAADQRPAVHLTFLIDTSGSMQSADKIDLVKTSLKLLTGELGDGDTVAIVAYAGSAGVILEPTPMSHQDDVLAALDRLDASGSTAMGAGISAAYQLAEQTYVAGAINRVILCSDGDANVGPTSEADLDELIHTHAEHGITLTTAGFGEGNYHDNVMEQLADQGDGNYVYIDSEEEARRVFVDQLTRTMDVIARDVKLQVAWNPDTVVSYRLIGYEDRDVADQDFRNDAADGGEVGAGHQVTALYEIQRKDATKGTLATVQVRNKAPGPDSPAVERKFPLDSSIEKASFEDTDRPFQVAVAAATFAEKLRHSAGGDGVTWAKLEDLATTAERAEYPEDAELVDLIRTADRLSGGDPTPPPAVRGGGAHLDFRARGGDTLGTRGKLRCTDGSTPDFDGAAELDFDPQALPVTCMVDIGGKMAAFHVEKSGTVTCTFTGSDLTCDASPALAPAATASLTVHILGDFACTSVEAKCGDLRMRGNNNGGTVVIPDLPTDGACELYFKGGAPVQFKPVHGGQTVSCTITQALASCREE